MTFLAGSPNRMFTMAEIARATGINAGSSFAVLNAMVESGLLYRDTVQKLYGLGPALVAIGQAALESHPVARNSQKAARELAYELDVAVLLTTKLGNDELVLGNYESRAGRKFNVSRGERLMFRPPLGAHLMAWAPDAEIEGWLAAAHLRPEVAEQWRDRLARIRGQGYRVSLRDPHRAGFTDLLARFATSGAEAARLAREKEAFREADHDFLLDDRFEEDVLYEVSTIAVPIFPDHDKPPLSLCIGLFEEALSGSQINGLVQKLLGTSMRLMETRRPGI